MKTTILLSTIIIILCSPIYSQDYKIAATNSTDASLVLDGFSGQLTIEGYAGNEIVISPAEKVETRKAELAAELKAEGKPEAMIEKIVEGKLNKWYEEVCLLNQKFIKNDEITIQELINEKIGTIGEKIEVIGFNRIEI